MFRIQKILLAEYQEIHEPVLVESPFAEVTEAGIGIRQVQLGLTPTQIIVGRDIFEKNSSFYLFDVAIVEKDPEIECFELVTVLPLDALRVSFYKKGSRMIMNIRVLEAKSKYFEFGGHLSQNLFWNTWRERIATIRQIGPNLFNLTSSSPFSSTDVIPDEEEVSVSIHQSPRSYFSSDCETTKYPLPGVQNRYKQFSSLYTDNIEKISSHNLFTESYHQMVQDNYLHSLSITNSFSCGCNTSW